MPNHIVEVGAIPNHIDVGGCDGTWLYPMFLIHPYWFVLAIDESAPDKCR